MLNKTSIGFHTICIFWRVTRNVANDLLKLLGSIEDIKIEKSKHNPNYFEVNYYKGKDRGVHWIIRFEEHKYRDNNGIEKENKKYYIEAIINPKILVGENDYIVAANETYIEPMIKAYDTMARDISPMLPLFQYGRLKEIHFCINFHLKELRYPYLTEQIMNLFKGGYIPPHYKELKKRCDKDHRMKSCDDSFYLFSDSVVVNCYDKQAQLRKKQKKYPKYDYSLQIEEAEGVIRFEIQCYYHKICNMLQDVKTHYDANYESRWFISFLDILKILLSDAMAKKVIYYSFSRVLGLGDYHTKSKAIEKVLEKCRSPKSDKLIAALELANEKRGIHKAKAFLDANVKAAKDSKDLDVLVNAITKAKDFCKALKKLNALNINPMTLPLEMSRKYKVSSIPNLLRTYLAIKGISEEEMKAGVVQWPAPTFYSDINL